MAEEEEYEEEEDEKSQKTDNNKKSDNQVVEPKQEEKKEKESKKSKGSKKSSTRKKKVSKVDENAYKVPTPEKVVSTRAFLESTVTSAIQEALLELARKRETIDDPLTYVGQYLIDKAKEKNK
jgi:hypothetical protein